MKVLGTQGLTYTDQLTLSVHWSQNCSHYTKILLLEMILFLVLWLSLLSLKRCLSQFPVFLITAELPPHTPRQQRKSWFFSSSEQRSEGQMWPLCLLLFQGSHVFALASFSWHLVSVIFLLVLLYRNKKKKQTHFKKISEVCKDEVSELLMNGHAGNANLPVFIKRFGIDPFWMWVTDEV